MKKTFLKALAFVAVLAVATVGAKEITDSSTGAGFPSEVTFSHGGTDYTLQATGVATRKKFIVKVYSVASYLQQGTTAQNDKFATILDDKAAKQLTLKWLRDVSSQQVTDGFKESLAKSFAPADIAAVQPNIDQFLSFFGKDVKTGDEQVLRWYPDGTVEVLINGTSVGTITDPAFAKGLWAIWFGPHSVVNRNDLVKELK